MLFRTLFLCALLAAAGCASSRSAGKSADVRPAAAPPCDCTGRFPTAEPSHTATLEEIHGAASSLAVVRVEAQVFEPKTESPDGAVSRQTMARSGGLGVVWSNDGLILTAAHVVRDALRVDVVLADGTRYRAVPYTLDASLDLAMLRIDLPVDVAARPPTLADSADDGMRVLAIGRGPGATSVDRRRGVVRHTSTSLQTQLDPSRRCDYSRLIETSLLLEPGCSGGPLLTADGRLLGINVAVDCCPRCGASRGYAQPVSAESVARLERRARSGESPGRVRFPQHVAISAAFSAAQ